MKKKYDGLEFFVNLITHQTRIQFLFDEKKFHLKLPNRMLNQQTNKSKKKLKSQWHILFSLLS